MPDGEYDYPTGNESFSSDGLIQSGFHGYLISSIDKPVAVHVFSNKVVIIQQNGTVTEIKRSVKSNA